MCLTCRYCDFSAPTPEVEGVTVLQLHSLSEQNPQTQRKTLKLSTKCTKHRRNTDIKKMYEEFPANKCFVWFVLSQFLIYCQSSDMLNCCVTNVEWLSCSLNMRNTAGVSYSSQRCLTCCCFRHNKEQVSDSCCCVFVWTFSSVTPRSMFSQWVQVIHKPNCSLQRKKKSRSPQYHSNSIIKIYIYSGIKNQQMMVDGWFLTLLKTEVLLKDASPASTSFEDSWFKTRFQVLVSEFPSLVCLQEGASVWQDLLPRV